jgi:hypothetical protein
MRNLLVPFLFRELCEMKNVVYIVLSFLRLTGFSGEKVVTYLQDRNGIKYEVNTEVGFTGVYVEKWDNGQKKKEEHYRDGKLGGLGMKWYDNGQKKWEKTSRMESSTDFGLSRIRRETSPNPRRTRMVS